MWRGFRELCIYLTPDTPLFFVSLLALLFVCSSVSFFPANMSLNPTLMANETSTPPSLVPNPYPSEVFFLVRDKIDFEIIDGGNTYKGSGRVYVTSHRLCFQERGMTKPNGR